MPFDQSTRIAAVNTPFGKDELGLLSLTGTESLSSIPRFELTLISEQKGLNPNKILGKTVSIALNTAHGQKKRCFQGHVIQFGRAELVTRYYAYRVVVAPWPWFLSLTTNCRIFQNKTVPDIVQKVCQDHGFDHIELRLNESYTPWEYCVQYRETDLNFISRLLEQEGICYFVKYEEDKHTLVLADSASSHQPFPGYADVKFRPINPADLEDREHIREFTAHMNHVTGAYAHTDYDFERPHTDLHSRSELPGSYARASFEVYDYPGEYVQYGDGESWARTRMEALHAQMEQASGWSDSRGILPGSVFSLKESPFPEDNRKYLVTSAQYELRSGEFESGREAAGDVFECRFTVQPADKQFRPQRKAEKPKVFGVQTAVVVGPKGEEIYTDKHSRIKAQFHWDREGKRDENSSCWVRVAQPWAGKGWGAVSIPRIGQEVVVDFLEGDPDQPLVIGNVYNGDQTPPYELPGKMVVSGVKSNTHKGKGYNEMSMDDTAKKEKIIIHAQYDMNTTVEHDATHTVVTGTFTETIKGNTTIHITDGDLEHKVIKGKADYSVEKTQATIVKLQIKDQSTEADILQQAKDKIRLDSDGKSTAELRPNGEIEIWSADEIKLITGKSSITLNKDGTILISGKQITISGTDETSLGVGNQNVKCDKQQVGTSGAAINSSAVGKHEISGAVVKIN